MLRKLFKKSMYYFATLVGGKILTAIVFILLARILQPEKFGLITYFITVVQLMSVLADFGLRSWYQKMMAKKDNLVLFSGLLTWRLIFYGVSVMVLLSLSLITDWLNISLLPPIFIALLFEALISVSDAYYLAQQKSIFLGYKLIARNLLLFTSLLLIKSPADYQRFFLIYNLALIGVLIFYFPLKALDWQWLTTSKKLPKIKTALPYASIDGLGIIYGRADGLMIENIINSAALGIYGAAYRYLDAFNLLPQALFHNLFPIAAKKNGINFPQVKKMVGVMTLLGLGVAAMVFFLSDWLTIMLMGEQYAAAGVILRYFSVVIVMFFFNAPLNTVIQSSDQVKRYVPKLGLIVAINIILNLILLPKIGLMGAVYTMIICEMILIIFNCGLIKKIYR